MASTRRSRPERPTGAGKSKSKRKSKSNGNGKGDGESKRNGNGKGTPSRSPAPAPPNAVTDPTFVVGLGGSAGSLEGFEEFFANMPPDSGMAFLVATHLASGRTPLLPQLLQRKTRMPVAPAADGDRLTRDTVYVIPPDRLLIVEDGRLRLQPLPRKPQPRTPIDVMLATLAGAWGAAAVGVVLSGLGSDGATGLRVIAEVGGLTFVQDPATAAFAPMPQAAIAALGSRLVAIDDAAALPGRILAVTASRPRPAGSSTSTSTSTSQTETIGRVLAILHARTGRDLSEYKAGSILRRLERRMMIHRLPDLDAYGAFLDQTPEEAELLLRELLIGVTCFFRDDEAFRAVAERALPELIAAKTRPRVVRAWVAGCSSGEEAYSLAIVLQERLEQLGADDVQLMIYATDLDKEAVATARLGRYRADIEEQVSPERLARWFVRDDADYRIAPTIRSKLVFAHHDLVADPSFTRLDIISCRNVLIYFQPRLQHQILSRFHHALVPGGVLVLGAAESASPAGDLFEPLEARIKVFRRVERALAAPGRAAATQLIRSLPMLPARVTGELSAIDAARREIVDSVAPPTLLVNPRGDILYTSRRVSRYLEPAVGKTNVNVLAMAREGLGVPLGLALKQAAARGRPVRRTDVEVRGDRGRYLVDLSVLPLAEPPALRGLLLVVFEERGAAPPLPRGRKRQTPPALERELARTRTHLQTMAREMDATQVQAEAANEELQSSNEELQSTNEELTTSREELQSLNEELLTINAELEAKIRDLATANDDLRNVLNSTRIPTLFLDRELRIKRFTSEASRVAHLIDGDVGREITDIALRLHYPQLRRDVEEVMATLAFKETQVASDHGAIYNVRIHPYRTMENTIDGVVITFVDVSALRGAEDALATRIDEAVLARLLDRWPGLVWVHDFEAGRDVYVNQAARERLQAGGRGLEAPFESLYHPDDARETVRWRQRLAKLPNGEVLTRRVRIAAPGGGHELFHELESVLTRSPGGELAQVLGVLEPGSDRR